MQLTRQKRQKRLAASLIMVCLLLSLTGCALFSKNTQQVAIAAPTPIDQVDTETIKCFEFITPVPGSQGEAVNEEQTEEFIATLIGSELIKNTCGQKLIGDYNDIKNEYDPDE